MDFSHLWIISAALMLLHRHEASSFTIMGPTVEEGPLAQLSHVAHQREKRCSCENQKDKECIFFCHIGIVWVNTPSHVVPYGFGSVRLRRDVRRCVCRKERDRGCSSFCSAHRDVGDFQVKTASDRHLKRSSSAFWEKRAFRQQT